MHLLTLPAETDLLAPEQLSTKRCPMLRLDVFALEACVKMYHS